MSTGGRAGERGERNVQGQEEMAGPATMTSRATV